MCVIVIKPAKVDISYEAVSKMWQKNSNGAGLAYFEPDGSIRVRKGFMRLKALWEELDTLQDKELVIHFRLATHGLVNPAQTHPFVLSRNINNAKAYNENKTHNIVLFHNGVVLGYGDKKYSDTLDFITRTLVEIPKLQTRLEVLELTNDKFVYMSRRAGICTVGTFHDYEGMKCSNLYFLPAKKQGKTLNEVYREKKWYDDYAFDAETKAYIELHEIDDYESMGFGNYGDK